MTPTPGACADPTCPVLHADPANPIHPPSRLTLDEYGLALAHVVKLRAACTRRQVGAVILGADKRVHATGYNGTPAGEKHCIDGGCPRGAFSYAEIPGFLGNEGHEVKCIAQHAEANAIGWVVMTRLAAAEWVLAQSTLYITCPPCPDCSALANKWKLRVVHS